MKKSPGRTFGQDLEKRLVVPVGSGMSLAGILWGLRDAGRTLPVVGVVVGADPAKRLDKWAPKGWRDLVQLEKSPIDYHAPAATTDLHGLTLDPQDRNERDHEQDQAEQRSRRRQGA